MSDSVLKQELLEPWLEVIITRKGKPGSGRFYPACGGAKYTRDQFKDAESIEFIRLKDDVFAGLLAKFRSDLAAAREEIAKLTLLSDSQLANQERLATGLVAIVTALGIADGTMPLTGPQVLLLADEAKHCCERLVGEMQELRQVVKEYRELNKPTNHGWQCTGPDRSCCSICYKADALLAPKDTPK